MEITTPSTESTETLESNKQLVRRIPEEITTGGNIDLVDEIFAENYVEHNSSLGEIQGREEMRELFSSFRAAFPDVRVTPEDLVAEGDRVAMRVRIQGTHEGPFLGVEPTGREVDFGGILVHRLADGKVAERWGVFDTLGMLRQMGVTELPA